MLVHSLRIEKRTVGLFILLAALAAAILGCDRKNAYVAPPPPKITVSRPEQRPVTEYIEFTGSTDPLESVNLTARVEGYLKSVHFADGARVSKGDLLFVIDPAPFEEKVQEAVADLGIQEARFRRAQTELDRSKRLLQEKAGSESDVVKWEQERDSSKSSIAMAKAKIELARINLGYTRVTAPFNGRIGRRMVDPGNLVGPGGKSQLATITRFDPIYAYFTLNERDLLRLKQSKAGLGPRTDISLELGMANEDGFPHAGKLDFADLGVDPSTGTLLLRGIFPNPNLDILTGLFVRIRAAVAKLDNALLVPARSLGQDQSGRYVLVVNDKNEVEQRSVTLGPSEGIYRVVAKGLSPSDRIVVNAVQKARPGSTVEPVEEKAGAASTKAEKGGD